jgi:peroxiredoxin
MAQLESAKTEFSKINSTVWYIAAEKRRGFFAPEEFFKKNPSSFPFLLDEDRSVTKSYGVYHRVGIDAWDIAHPASFVVGPDAKIRYIYVGQTQLDRAPLEAVLQALTAAR